MVGSISFHNRTEIPVVFVISQVGPLYWGVLQPGEDAIRKTGHVWFSIDVYPYDGTNEPTNMDAVKSIAVPVVLGLVAALRAGWGVAPAAIRVVLQAALPAGFLEVAPKLASALITHEHPISLKGFYVGGDEHITIVDGPKDGIWQPIRRG